VGQTLSKLEPQYAGRVAFVTVDVEEAQELAGQYQVNRLPTLILFEGGQVAAVVVGLQPASNIQCVLDSHR
jgi:thioredoxin 1